MKTISEGPKYLNLTILTCDSLINTMKRHRLILTNKMEEFTSYKGLIDSSNELWLTDCFSKLFLSKCVILFLKSLYPIRCFQDSCF